MVESWKYVLPARARTVRQLTEMLLARTAVCALAATFLALLIAEEASSAGIKVTSLLSDLATVGALVGLATCAPTCAVQVLRVIRFLWDEDVEHFVHSCLVTAIFGALVLVKVASKVLAFAH